MLLYVLTMVKKYVARIVDRIVLLSPVTWMDLPSVDVEQLEAKFGQSYLGGDGWNLRVGGICD